MSRAEHRAHRWRIASRCIPCNAPVVWACRYRTCAATRTVLQRRGARHECAAGSAPAPNLVAAARRIFRGNIARVGVPGEWPLWTH